MENIEKIIYRPLKEDDTDDVTGWSKGTVDYVTSHKSKVERQIRGIARGLRKNGLQTIDVEDIYSEVLLYLYNCSDYDINRAIDRSSTANMVSLEGYLNVCIKYCVIRFCTQLTTLEKEVISESITSSDDKELSIFDTVADPKSEITLDNLVYNLEELCQSCESVRYRFGPDIYQVLYVKLLSAADVEGDAYKTILGILSITKKDLCHFDRNSEDSIIRAFAKAISITDSDEAIRILEKYVYSAKLIKRAVLGQLN